MHNEDQRKGTNLSLLVARRGPAAAQYRGRSDALRVMVTNPDKTTTAYTGLRLSQNEERLPTQPAWTRGTLPNLKKTGGTPAFRLFRCLGDG